MVDRHPSESIVDIDFSLVYNVPRGDILPCHPLKNVIFLYNVIL